MDKLLLAMERVAEDVFADFMRRGGIVHDAGRNLSLMETASLSGALTPILWMQSEFASEYGLPFPGLVFKASGEALCGVVIETLDVSRSASPAVFMLSDFLRNEVIGEIVDLDLSLLFENFREWAAGNVPGVAPYSGPGGDRRPE